MKVSYQWLKELVDFKLSPQELADLLTARGLEVEELTLQSKGMEKVVSGHILDKGKHPDSDRLSFCRVDVGASAGGTLEIVCGATNHKTGDKVAVALVGAELPNGMKIGKGKIRGVESHGMLCSEAELGLSKESEGIIILPSSTPIGRPIAEVLDKNDAILTLKVYANQGHYLSHLGVAREIAAALTTSSGRTVKVKLPSSTSGKGNSAVDLNWKGAPVSIALEAGEKAPQFFGCQVDGVKIGPSPKWLVRKLEAVGSRSINNIVDATNLVMLELGHPVHAYDATKIADAKIGVRLAKKGEELPLLDDSKVTLDGTELVIFDGSGKAIGLAGVMGGGNSEVSDSTTKVFLECAEFDPVLVRKAKTKFVKMTDAATRFERGVDPMGLPNVLNRLASLVIELGGGKVVGSVKAQISKPKERPTIEMPTSYVRDFIGLDVKESEVVSHLEALECEVIKKSGKKGDVFRVTPPSYRLDLNLREDLSEEVARSVGYDRIPSTMPVLSSPPVARAFDAQGSEQILLYRAKDAFVRAGLCETLNYGFTSAKRLADFGFETSLRVQNPLSEEHEFMVPSLIPGLVGNALENYRHHFGSETPIVRLFEIRPTFQSANTGLAAVSDFDTGIVENWKIAFALSGTRYASALRAEIGEVDFYDGKAILEVFLDQMGAKGIRYIPLHASRNANHPVAKVLHPGQAIEVLAGNQTLGHFGLLHPGIARKLKIKESLYVAELDWGVLLKMCRAASQARAFKGWSEFPPIERDFAILVDSSTTADQVLGVLTKAGRPLVKSAKIFDVYRGEQVAAGKVSIAARVVLQDDSRSLTEAEAEGASNAIIAALKKDLRAELR